MPHTTYVVSAPRSITTVNTLAFAVLAGLSTWFGWKFAHAMSWSGWETVILSAALFLVLQSYSVHVPWWRTATLDADGLTLTRGKGPAEIWKAPWSGRAVIAWQDVEVERVVIARIGPARTRVTFHLPPATAAGAWNKPPFAGFAPYREGYFPYWLHKDRGFAWSLGDIDAPADEIAEAFRACAPPEVLITAVGDTTPPPRYYGPRRTRLVGFVLLLGIPLVLLALLSS